MVKTLILPAFNEAKYIQKIIKQSEGFVDNIIVVDNNSTDKTVQIAKSTNAIVLHHIINLGKSASLKTGCEAALKLESDIIILMDSDGQHSPDDLPRLISLIENENCDMVIGSRTPDSNMPLIRKIGFNLLRFSSQLLYSLKIDDIQSGFRAFRSNIYKYIEWSSTGRSHYFADAEMTVRAAINKIHCKQIIIDTLYNDQYKGMDPIQGLRLLLNIFIWRLLINVRT